MDKHKFLLILIVVGLVLVGDLLDWLDNNLFTVLWIVGAGVVCFFLFFHDNQKPPPPNPPGDTGNTYNG
jgi:hypothetical protein